MIKFSEFKDDPDVTFKPVTIVGLIVNKSKYLESESDDKSNVDSQLFKFNTSS